MADNRVVIKINYDKDQRRKEVIDPRMITVWHRGRILTALSVLTLLIIILGLFWPEGDKLNNKPDSPQGSGVSENNVSQPAATQTAVDSHNNIGQSDERIVRENRQPPNAAEPTAVILDKRVIRASLNTTLKDREPGEPTLSPVIVETGKTRELFYFSQVRAMKDKVLFHHWLKDGQLVYKKRLNIKGDGSILISSRIFNLKDAGNWRVVLIDAKGKHFSRVDFKVDLQ